MSQKLFTVCDSLRSKRFRGAKFRCFARAKNGARAIFRACKTLKPRPSLFAPRKRLLRRLGLRKQLALDRALGRIGLCSLFVCESYPPQQGVWIDSFVLLLLIPGETIQYSATFEALSNCKHTAEHAQMAVNVWRSEKCDVSSRLRGSDWLWVFYKFKGKDTSRTIFGQIWRT